MLDHVAIMGHNDLVDGARMQPGIFNADLAASAAMSDDSYSAGAYRRSWMPIICLNFFLQLYGVQYPVQNYPQHKNYGSQIPGWSLCKQVYNTGA